MSAVPSRESAELPRGMLESEAPSSVKTELGGRGGGFRYSPLQTECPKIDLYRLLKEALS